jgi:sulfur relay (sulfurtransferase) complex TusBCD TusD component (DsrE family)
VRRYRCTSSVTVTYGFGDASGRGFGATLHVNGNIYMKMDSNLALALERLLRENKMTGSKIFIFTDNATAEAAFWKSTSASERLFELVLRLRELELEYDLILHVVHLAENE